MENQEDPAKNAAPIINPVIIKHNASSKSSSISSNPKTPRAPLTGPGSGKPIDVHPYIRGSVIEVRYSQKNPDDWFDFTPDKIYLCDIIDRMPLAENTSKDPKDWRYYVHYRELNRRMDEWISGERVVSPPSVGNAKARALKKKKDEEERERVRRERAKDEQRRASLMASVSIRKMGDEMSGDDDVNSGDERRKSRRSVLRRAASSDGGSYEVLDAVSSQLAAEGGEARLTRRQRRKTGDGEMILSAVESSADNSQSEEHFAMDVVTTLSAPTLDEHEGMDEAALKEHEEVTKVKNVATLELGEYQMDTWYFSPLPKEFLPGGMIDVLYVDEFSLNFFTRKIELQRYHERELPRGRRHPPGNEIYRCGNLSMFEVDGYEQRIYCQNLCYIAKLFLDHKTLYYDVDPFLFYVLCEVDERGYHPVGYYSKEKYSDVGYNLACILTFPAHQRKGYGRFLIAFSYELSKKEEKVGSPEKPMSDLGQQAYIPYWTSTIVDFLLNQCPESKSLSIMDIAKQTSIMAEDIIFAMNTLGILKFVNGVYFISAEKPVLEELAKKHPIKEPRVDPSKLHWTPYLTDVKRDKFSISSKKPSVEADNATVTL